jgi:hypothetical protein
MSTASVLSQCKSAPLSALAVACRRPPARLSAAIANFYNARPATLLHARHCAAMWVRWSSARLQNHSIMKKIVVLAVVSLACSIGMAAGDKAPTAQQKLMGTCNTEAAGKKGDERKEFMKSCLSDGKKRQQERMKTCNVDATGKKGDERKAFMSECLKKD